MNELKTLKGNYKIYRFTIGCLSAFAIVMGLLYTAEAVKNANTPESIYVLDGDGNVGTAVKRTLGKDEITAEVINNLAMFTRLMYENDQHSYDRNVTLAIELAGDVGKDILEQKRQDKEFEKMVQLNVRSTVEVDYDSFAVNRSDNGRIYGNFSFNRNLIRNEQETVIMKLEVEYTLVRTGQARTAKNPHAMMIAEYNVVSSTRIK